MTLLPDLLDTLLVALVLLGAVPVVTSAIQFLMVGRHSRSDHYANCRNHTPRVAVVVPAWNEGNVIAASIDMLMRMDYPPEALRVYVVDDASTDDTPQVVQAKSLQYRGQVFHLRRERGGQGKAHTLNHGLREVLVDDWAEAVLIMDADVLFERPTLRRMARHLADPEVGAVTAYIKEGSQPGNLVSRYVAFEYITAQAAARRAQNVMGALACLAGGAQLHSRDNLEAIGGEIDTTTLAEDTLTTFRTQLTGSRVVFDGNAIVWAEEPGSLVGLWKQRLRWARGNLQLTRIFKGLWFRRSLGTALAAPLFGLVWFSIVLMPVFMVLASIGLVGLYLLNPPKAWHLLSLFWGLSAATYCFVTFFSFAIDPATAKRAWFEGLTFQGLAALAIMVFSFAPQRLLPAELLQAGPRLSFTGFDLLMIVVYGWNVIGMALGWALYRLEKAGLPARLRDVLLVIVGYGPVLCAITFASYVSEYRKVGLQWDKTEKSGKVRILN
ncbi:MAG: glycosyltransferase family 2 protein [Burkholderiales bacterium]|jgi:cellulose synthase/poly-beta-1,6-N-acetylglucosamine synthase-like glycosyltransferase|nr:glycosyltransferase family 2 protein [Burkholderiales bacterium]